MTNYTTVQGDMWDAISKKQYGSERFMPQLLKANPDYANYVIFPAGIVLSLPEIDTSTAVNLPPWKR